MKIDHRGYPLDMKLDTLDMSALKEKMRIYARSLGFFDVRVAVSHLPQEHKARLDNWLSSNMHGEMEYMARHPRDNVDVILPGCRSVLVFAASYFPHRDFHSSSPQSRDEDHVRVAKYALGRDYHYVLKDRLTCMVEWLNERIPDKAWRICVDSAPLLERAFAAEAGVGFIGKNSMLIAPGQGSFFFLAEILTTAELPPDLPRPGTCGTCTRCIDACPTQAIVGPGTIDSRSCISYLTIEKKTELRDDEQRLTGEWAFGCDICQDVCPYNKHPEPTPFDQLREKFIEEVQPARKFMAPQSNREFEREFTGSPVLRAGRKRLQRNVAAASAAFRRRTKETI